MMALIPDEAAFGSRQSEMFEMTTMMTFFLSDRRY
jgi:hypothetical protein